MKEGVLIFMVAILMSLWVASLGFPADGCGCYTKENLYEQLSKMAIPDYEDIPTKQDVFECLSSADKKTWVIINKKTLECRPVITPDGWIISNIQNNGLIFVSYQGWYLNIKYLTGWEVIEYNKPISTHENIEEIAKIIDDAHPELDHVIILNWHRLEGEQR